MSEAVKFLPQIKAAFKYVLPIAVALNESHPYEEEDITYPNFEQYIAGQVNASNADMPSQLDTTLGQQDASSSSSSSSSASGSASSGAAAASGSSSAKSSASAGSASPSQSSKPNAAGQTTQTGALTLFGGAIIAIALASL
jgi:hypothetical protein